MSRLDYVASEKMVPDSKFQIPGSRQDTASWNLEPGTWNPGELIVTAADQAPEEEAHAQRNRDRGAGILLHVAERFAPHVAVVFLDALRGRLDALADVLAHVVELLAGLRVGLSEDLLGLIDFLFDEVAGPIKRSLFRHPSPPVPKAGSYTLGWGEASQDACRP